MKVLLTVLLSFHCLIGFTQTPTDSLSAYITRNHYVRLTDTAHLTKNIIPYLHLIAIHLSATNYGKPDDVYINAAAVWETSGSINIPIVHINGIKTLKHEEDEAAELKKRDTIINGHFQGIEFSVIGNPGGEHDLVINKADNTLKYYMQQ